MIVVEKNDSRGNTKNSSNIQFLLNPTKLKKGYH